MRYAKMENGRPVFAGNVVRVDGEVIVSPTDAQYRRAGFKPYVDEGGPYELAEGHHWERSGWDSSGDSIIQLYRAVEDPAPPPRTYDLYKLLLALKQIEVTVDGQTVTANVPLVKWAEENGLYEELMMARRVRADDKDFEAGLAAAKSMLGLTDGQVEALLASARIR